MYNNMMNTEHRYFYVIIYPMIYLHLYINSHGSPACMYTIYIHTVHKPFNKGRYHVKLTFGTTFGKNPTVNQMNTDASQYFLLRSTTSYMFPETISIRYSVVFIILQSERNFFLEKGLLL
jgi:hypothetical protein